MWTREELKTRAKAVLKVAYWKAFLVSLLLALFCTGSGGSSYNFLNNSSGNYNYRYGSDLFGFASAQGMGYYAASPSDYLFAAMGLGVITFVFLAALAFGIFVSGPLEVGCRRYFTSACCYQFELGNLGFSFKGGRYLAVTWAMLYRALFNFLWYLLFFIPGIVKGYAYSMVPYILADNPNIGAKRAVQLSQDMTRGHKLDIFVLELSFLGWYLLGALACGIGVLFVNPYSDSTHAELYMVLRHNALMNGMTTMEELCLAGGYNPNPPQGGFVPGQEFHGQGGFVPGQQPHSQGGPVPGGQSGPMNGGHDHQGADGRRQDDAYDRTDGSSPDIK